MSPEMPDDAIHLTFPADADLAPVASIAVRAAARQVALSEHEIDRLRAAVVTAVNERAAAQPEAPVELTMRPGAGRLEVSLDGDPIS
jgi:hypothetical protein